MEIHAINQIGFGKKRINWINIICTQPQVSIITDGETFDHREVSDAAPAPHSYLTDALNCSPAKRANI